MNEQSSSLQMTNFDVLMFHIKFIRPSTYSEKVAHFSTI